MSPDLNDLGQPIGFPLPDWQPPPIPPRTAMTGRYCRVEPLDPVHHADSLHAAVARDVDDGRWTYLPYGPFASAPAFRAWLDGAAASLDLIYFAVVDAATNEATGWTSYLRIMPAAGSIEVGSIVFSPLLQRTRAATEAMFLMMDRAFGLGYRRYEWKCDSYNAPSCAAAARLGFSFEGQFRQAQVVKGRNRDTAWFSIIDREWPALRAAFERWLDPGNFDSAGWQRTSLSALTRAALAPPA